MKKFIYCVLIALITISCQKDEEPWENSFVIPQTLSAYTPELDSAVSESKGRALCEDQAESWDESKTVNSRTYAVVDNTNAREYIQYWSDGDAISVFSTTANLKYGLTSLEYGENDYGHFQLVGDATQGMQLTTDYYYAVYPYKENTSINYKSGEITYNFPKNQQYNGDSYAVGENGMIARELNSGDGILYFQNFCSYLQLRMTANEGQPKTVKQIILKANNPNDKMTGDAAITFNGEAPVVNMKMNSFDEIILNCGNGIALSQDTNNPSKFWFVLPGNFTFTDGFKITVSFSDNSYFEKSTAKQISIARSHIKPMATFTPTIEEGGDLELTSPIRYKYNNTSIEDEPYPLEEKEIFYDVDGNLLQVINQQRDEETGEWIVYLSGKLGKIGGNGFQESSPNIEYIKVQENTDSIIIDNFAFYNCTAERIEINNNVKSIGTSVITGSTIQNVVINGGVSVISKGAFAGSFSLQTVTMESVETIGENAFYMCLYLREVSVPNVKYIDNNAFENCISLQSITLDSIVTIDDAAFFGCTSLTSVEISSQCTMIGEGAFCNANSLKTVICHAVKPPFIKTDNSDKSYVFDKASSELVIYIPNESNSYNYYTDQYYFVNNNSGYTSPVKATVNWWYEEYIGKLRVK